MQVQEVQVVMEEVEVSVGDQVDLLQEVQELEVQVEH